MYALSMPWSQYTLDVGFEPILPCEKTGNFLDVSSPKLYKSQVIDPIANRGLAMQKDASIFAWPLGIAEEIATKDISGSAEMSKKIGNFDLSPEAKNNAKSELFMVFSSHQFNYKQALQTYTMAHSLAAMAKSSLGDEELEALKTGMLRFKLNTSAYGVWTMDAKGLGDKYNRYEDKRFPDVYLPKPEALRIIAPVQAPKGYDGIEMPTNWGSFKVQNGGHIAIAVDPEDGSTTGYQQFQRNMDALKAKKGSVKSLFLTQSDSAVLSKLDIYGIEPGYVASNYKSIPMNG